MLCIIKYGAFQKGRTHNVRYRRLLGLCVLVAGTGLGCRSNNLLLGRVEATVAEHSVVVTDCYRIRVPRPEPLDGVAGGPDIGAHFMPCRDADLTIRQQQLTVNGRTYGRLQPGDHVTVDHGRVLINDQPATAR